MLKQLAVCFNTNDGRHLEAYLCSSKYLWNNGSLMESTVSGLPLKFRIIKSDGIKHSASGIFCAEQMRNALYEIKIVNKNIEKVVVVDLLKEYHGFVNYNNNGIPVTLRAHHNTVNFGVNYYDVENFEQEIFKAINEEHKTKLNIVCNFESKEGGIATVEQLLRIHTKGIVVEREMLEKIGIPGVKTSYLRLPCVDHSSPPYEAIATFAAFVQNEFDSKTDWLHIHCHGGKGRSTSFSLLFDMFMRLKNDELHKISFTKLLNFHVESGGKDLKTQKSVDDSQYGLLSYLSRIFGGSKATKAEKSVEWKQEMAEMRYDLLQRIYENLLTIQKYGLKNIFSRFKDDAFATKWITSRRIF